MKKLTLVTILCRDKVVTTFVMLPVYNGKTVIHKSTITKLFKSFWEFIPERGETISFL